MSLIDRRFFMISIQMLFAPKNASSQIWRPDFASIERRSGGKFGLYAIDTGSGRTLGWRADDRFPFCSSSKAPLAAYVLWLADQGKLSLDQPVYYGESDLLPYAPVTRAAVSEGVLPISELCKAAVTLSDNTAANLLWRETGGPKALTAWMRSIGDAEFTLTSEEPGLNLSRYGDAENTTTPRAMAESFRRFVLDNILSLTSRNKLQNWLLASTTGSKRLRAGLPPSWRTGDKTGTYNETWFSTIDVAVTWPILRPPLIISGFLTSTPDTESAEHALADAARAIRSWVA